MKENGGVSNNAVTVEPFFGEWLVGNSILTEEQLSSALTEQKEKGGRLGEVLIRLKVLNAEQITDALSKYLKIERVKLANSSEIDMNAARAFPENLAKRFCLVVIGKQKDKTIIAMADPLDIVARDIVSAKLNSAVKVVISSSAEIQYAIELIYHGSDITERNLRDLVELEFSDDDSIAAEDNSFDDSEIAEEDAAAQAPVIRFVDLLLSQAVKSRASDVHVEPQENAMIVRMRIDGILRDMVPPPRKMQAGVLTRIKILSNMDIAERRLPQDGRFRVKSSGREIDVRVSTIPTIYGEKIVMRILDPGAVNHDIEKLGLEPQVLDELKQMLAQPYGIIVVTGPTGSGKSTTLYSALNYLKDPEKNITTVEDPVEYRLWGINQIQVKPEIELDFAKCLRAILRQDPDIILIGEIRDKETVEIAIKASLTGHLVLSTFHTNDAPSAISRLMYMGIEPYLLASSLNLILAQRLVRKICDNCKEPVKLDSKVLARMKIDEKTAKNAIFYRGRGCKICGDTGYMGRLPIFEFMPIDSEIRGSIAAGATELQLRSMLRDKGYGGLFEYGVKKVLEGVTTAEEVFSATFVEDTKR